MTWREAERTGARSFVERVETLELRSVDLQGSPVGSWYDRRCSEPRCRIVPNPSGEGAVLAKLVKMGLCSPVLTRRRRVTLATEARLELSRWCQGGDRERQRHEWIGLRSSSPMRTRGVSTRGRGHATSQGAPNRLSPKPAQANTLAVSSSPSQRELCGHERLTPTLRRRCPHHDCNRGEWGR